jgi:hypothetical protein
LGQSEHSSSDEISKKYQAQSYISAIKINNDTKYMPIGISLGKLIGNVSNIQISYMVSLDKVNDISQFNTISGKENYHFAALAYEFALFKHKSIYLLMRPKVSSIIRYRIVEERNIERNLLIHRTTTFATLLGGADLGLNFILEDNFGIKAYYNLGYKIIDPNQAIDQGLIQYLSLGIYYNF